MFPGIFITETYPQPWAQDSLGAQNMAQPWDRELRSLKICGIRPEAHRRPSLESAHLAHHLQFGHLVAIGKRHVIFLAPTSNPDLQTYRERVHYRHADAV